MYIHITHPTNPYTMHIRSTQFGVGGMNGMTTKIYSISIHLLSSSISLSLSLFSDNIWFCAILCHCNVVCVHLSILLLLLLWKSFGIDIPTTRVWLMVADEWLFSLYLFCVNKRWVDEWMRGRQWLRVQIAWNEGCRDVSSVSDVNRVALVMY